MIQMTSIKRAGKDSNVTLFLTAGFFLKRTAIL